MPVRTIVIALLATLVAALSACGGSGTPEEKPASASVAIAEIAKTRAALERARAQVGAGDRKGADETVASGYLDHFEKVEAPLARVDEPLKERLEDLITRDLRRLISSGAPVASVQALIGRIEAGLTTARTKLR